MIPEQQGSDRVILGELWGHGIKPVDIEGRLGPTSCSSSPEDPLGLGLAWGVRGVSHFRGDQTLTDRTPYMAPLEDRQRSCFPQG